MSDQDDAVICASCHRRSPSAPGEHGTTWIVCDDCKAKMRGESEARRIANWEAHERRRLGDEPTQPGYANGVARRR